MVKLPHIRYLFLTWLVSVGTPCVGGGRSSQRPADPRTSSECSSPPGWPQGSSQNSWDHIAGYAWSSCKGMVMWSEESWIIGPKKKKTTTTTKKKANKQTNKQNVIYRRSVFNCKLQVFPTLAINRFANTNVRVYYNMVRGRPPQLLDSQFGLTCLERNH